MKTKVLLAQAMVIVADLRYTGLGPSVLLFPNTFTLFCLLIFLFWLYLKKSLVHTKFDMSVCITITGLNPL